MSTLSSSPSCSVILIGCGLPLRGMGWYHATQLLEGRCDGVVLKAVVEGWFLGDGREGEQGQAFKKWVDETKEKHPDVTFASSLSEVAVDPNLPTLALISGRTSSNPPLLTECIAAGIKTVYLEKPGAPTVEHLVAMRKAAADAGVKVLMGFNKNVSKYVTLLLSNPSYSPSADVKYSTNNAYSSAPADLGECFERNSEGMIRNMCVHEVCLLVTLHGLRVENSKDVTVDQGYTVFRELEGPGGKIYGDFEKVRLTIATEGGGKVTLQANRCGGNNESTASFTNPETGDICAYSMPDSDDVKRVEELKAAYPGAMEYFYAQDADYAKLKSIAGAVSRGEQDRGMPSIDDAVETMRLATYLEEVVKKAVKN